MPRFGAWTEEADLRARHWDVLLDWFNSQGGCATRRPVPARDLGWSTLRPADTPWHYERP